MHSASQNYCLDERNDDRTHRQEKKEISAEIRNEWKRRKGGENSDAEYSSSLNYFRCSLL